MRRKKKKYLFLFQKGNCYYVLRLRDIAAIFTVTQREGAACVCGFFFFSLQCAHNRRRYRIIRPVTLIFSTIEPKSRSLLLKGQQFTIP